MSSNPSTAQSCQAVIQQGPNKGKACGNKATGLYCAKHIRSTIHDKASSENIRYCDISRGCYTVLEDHQSKCIVCLHKARIHDRKRHDKKRQDKNLCLDCGNPFTEETRAKGKHDRLLRRCVPCYETLKKVEADRTPRERNYKVEQFKNKHVIWNHYVKGAQKRGIHFQLTKTHFESLLIKPCFYCLYHKEGEVKGIDRLDNNKGYVEDNTVPCCQRCNDMKGSQHPLEFIDKLYAIHTYRMTDIPISPLVTEKWRETYRSKTIPTYRSYAKSASSRTIPFSLTEEQFLAIVNQSCYLCGIPVSETNHNGIDRVNNTVGYAPDNCKTCCGHCNLLKKTNTLTDVYHIASQVVRCYDTLTASLSEKVIPMRASKVAPRQKVTEPLITQEAIPMEYKSTEEVIHYTEPPKEITERLEAKQSPNPPKQWKTSIIYQVIQNHQENEYKTFCEEKNDMSLLPTWESDWATFILSVKGRSEAEGTPIITAFVENLRRIRHNKLCHDTNASLVDKEGRQQWPAVTVVRAFLDGKIDAFKAFTEASTNEDPADPKWIKRWSEFMARLEASRDQPEQMKTLCSKLMTAQRTKKYRHRKDKGKQE